MFNTNEIDSTSQISGSDQELTLDQLQAVVGGAEVAALPGRVAVGAATAIGQTARAVTKK